MNSRRHMLTLSFAIAATIWTAFGCSSASRSPSSCYPLEETCSPGMEQICHESDGCRQCFCTTRKYE